MVANMLCGNPFFFPLYLHGLCWKNGSITAAFTYVKSDNVRSLKSLYDSIVVREEHVLRLHGEEAC